MNNKPARHGEPAVSWTLHPVEKLSDFSNQIDALARSRPGTPFLETAFLQAAIEVFGTGDELLCLLHGGDGLRAAAIMQRSRPGVWQTFQPSQLPLGAWISDGRTDLESTGKALLAKLPGIALVLGFSQLDPRLQERNEDTPMLKTQDYMTTAWVAIEGSFQSYWEARGKNLKQNLRKQRNKLSQEGLETRIECITSPRDVRQAIEDYALLEGAGWKAADGKAIQPDDEQGRFYRTLLEAYCAMGRGRIYRCYFGDKVTAMDLCIHDEEAIVILKTAYDESFKAVSPSSLMRHDQFQQLFEERRFSRIEFFGKVMEWHTRWTSESRLVFHATVYRWPWLKILHEFYRSRGAQQSFETPAGGPKPGPGETSPRGD